MILSSVSWLVILFDRLKGYRRAGEITTLREEMVDFFDGADIAGGGSKTEDGKGMVGVGDFNKPALVSQGEHLLVKSPGMPDIDYRIGVPMNQQDRRCAL